MTYLTQVTINPYNGDFRRLLSDANVMHRAVMALFPQASDSAVARQEFGVLWFMIKDRSGVPRAVIIQSDNKPDLSLYVAKTKTHQVSLFNVDDFEVQEYDAYLSQAKAGVIVQLDVIMSTTKTTSRRADAETGIIPSGKRVAVRGRDEMIDLFVSRVKNTLGVEVIPGTCMINGAERIRYTRGKDKRVYEEASRFICTVQIVDPETFIQGVGNGIGRAKAFGAGMVKFTYVTKG